jgi:hypothetical protein
MLWNRFTWRNINIVHTLLRCRTGNVEILWQMVMAIPRELSLGYWLRIERTLPTHYRYAMMTIHMRGYHFEETKQKGVYDMQTIYTVDRTCENAKLHVVVIEFVISNFWIYFQLFSVFFSSVGLQFLVAVSVPLSLVSVSSVERRGYCSVPLNFNMDIVTATRTMHVLVDYAHCRTWCTPASRMLRHSTPELSC